MKKVLRNNLPLRLAVSIIVCFSFVISPASHALAEDAGSSPVISSIMPNIQTALYLSRIGLGEGIARTCLAGTNRDTGYSFRPVRYIRTADVTPDITTVRVPASSLDGTGSGKDAKSLLDSARGDIAILTSDAGHPQVGNGGSTVTRDVGSADGNCRSDASPSRDDYIGHIREFLQTKK